MYNIVIKDCVDHTDLSIVTYLTARSHGLFLIFNQIVIDGSTPHEHLQQMSISVQLCVLLAMSAL